MPNNPESTPIYNKMISRWPGETPEEIMELYSMEEPVGRVSEATLED